MLPGSMPGMGKRGRHVSLFFCVRSEIRNHTGIILQNVLSILLEKLVGTGSIKISRTVLPGWDPDLK
jgi:hypothetical protein